MASKVDIWNAALTALGRQIVANETENSTRANLVRSRYDNVRQNLLEDQWTFATKRVKLARLSTPTPVTHWQYYFQLPPDWLSMISVSFDVALRREAHYQLEDGRQLAADDEEIWIRYVADIEDPNIMTPSFREYLSAELAYQICIRSTELSGRRADMKSWRDDAMNRARSKDAQSDSNQVTPEDSWISARFGGHTVPSGNWWRS